MKVKPTEDRILVRRDKPEDKTPGGLFLPETVKDKPLLAKVVAVGPGKFVDGRHVPQFKIGDRVILSKYAGTEISVDGQEMLILREEEVLAVVE